MSNTNYSDIDAILGVMDSAKSNKEQEELQAMIGANVQKIQYDIKLDKRNAEVEANRQRLAKVFEQQNKSVRTNQNNMRPVAVSSYKNNPIQEILETIKEYKGIIAGVLAASAIVLATYAPTLRANGQINELSNSLSDEFEKLNYGDQQNNLFRKFNLTIEPSEFVNNLGLTPNSHMRLYILSTVIQSSDFENILRELGYNGMENYVEKLGFRHNENLRASEQYNIKYNEKLKKIIMELNKNPENMATYLEEYPELRFIYDSNNTILVNGQMYTTESTDGRSR